MQSRRVHANGKRGQDRGAHGRCTAYRGIAAWRAEPLVQARAFRTESHEVKRPVRDGRVAVVSRVHRLRREQLGLARFGSRANVDIPHAGIERQCLCARGPRDLCAWQVTREPIVGANQDWGI